MKVTDDRVVRLEASSLETERVAVSCVPRVNRLWLAAMGADDVSSLLSKRESTTVAPEPRWRPLRVSVSVVLGSWKN